MKEYPAVLRGFQVRRDDAGVLRYSLAVEFDEFGMTAVEGPAGTAEHPGTVLTVLVARLLEHFWAASTDDLRDIACVIRADDERGERIVAVRSFARTDWLELAR
jgi:hypothetical protein